MGDFLSARTWRLRSRKGRGPAFRRRRPARSDADQRRRIDRGVFRTVIVILVVALRLFGESRRPQSSAFLEQADDE
jgi:hypothetical protein